MVSQAGPPFLPLTVLQYVVRMLEGTQGRAVQQPSELALSDKLDTSD